MDSFYKLGGDHIVVGITRRVIRQWGVLMDEDVKMRNEHNLLVVEGVARKGTHAIALLKGQVAYMNKQATKAHRTMVEMQQSLKKLLKMTLSKFLLMVGQKQINMMSKDTALFTTEIPSSTKHRIFLAYHFTHLHVNEEL